jgi:hypothetical protein
MADLLAPTEKINNAEAPEDRPKGHGSGTAGNFIFMRLMNRPLPILSNA